MVVEQEYIHEQAQALDMVLVEVLGMELVEELDMVLGKEQGMEQVVE